MYIISNINPAHTKWREQLCFRNENLSRTKCKWKAARSWLFCYINEANWKLPLNPCICAYEHMQFKSLRFIEAWSGCGISLELMWSPSRGHILLCSKWACMHTFPVFAWRHCSDCDDTDAGFYSHFSDSTGRTSHLGLRLEVLLSKRVKSEIAFHISSY